MEASVVGLPGRMRGRPSSVAAKFASDAAQDNDTLMLYNEALSMRQFAHTHVVRLLGVCFREAPSCILLELMSNGDLKSYLRAWTAHSGRESESAFTREHMDALAAQCCSGVVYLASIKYVHRDLAARNVVVSDAGLAKIGDFGMSRTLRANDYYRSSSKSPWALPIRWMAPESFFDGTWTVKSDIWSFAVLLWEIYSGSETPWGEQTEAAIMPAIQQRRKLPCPPDCPQELYGLLLQCWRLDANGRPPASHLAAAFLAHTAVPDTMYLKLVWPSLSVLTSGPREQRKASVASLRDTDNDVDIFSDKAVAGFSAMLVARDKVTIKDLLGAGAFGEVRLGLWTNEAHVPVKVAVKTVKADDSEARDKFILEARTLAVLRHPHIVELLAACVDDDGSLMVIEFMPCGDLLSFLRANNPAGSMTIKRKSTQVRLLTVADLIGPACQIADAMSYLERMRVIHRDLAARNILVETESPLSVKLSDLGLARTLKASEYYKKTSADKVPIKWMAPESISDKKYTTKSDVWSFGVLLWELFSLGDKPYSDLSPMAMLAALLRGYRMPRPPLCPPDVYDLMVSSWQFEASARPSFRSLESALTDIRDSLDTTHDESHL
eukprot:m.431795 g.431795  ORF g.431795 m.431795 type:complete len:609 (+) comp56741_c2_seq11:2038-3864(+)